MKSSADLVRKCWPILREAAIEGRTLTYTHLAQLAGPPLHRRRLHQQVLTPLGHLCRWAEMPPLPALVVRQDTGTPGQGYHSGQTESDPLSAWADDLAACWAYPWPPEPPKQLLAKLDQIIEQADQDDAWLKTPPRRRLP
jgi:hypothetical protein